MFLSAGKTNWKYIVIVVILGIIAGAGILWWTKIQGVPFAQFPEIKKPEKIIKEEKVYNEEDLPRFEDFLVSEEFKNSPASPDFSTDPFFADPTRAKFKEIVIEQAKEGPNFAGHFTIVQWSCGTECQSGVIVDAETGKIYNLPGSEFGRDFRINSNLLIINPPETIESLHPYYPYDELGNLPEWVDSEYYKWENNQFNLIYKYKPEFANWKTYRNEEYGFEVKYPKDWELQGELTINFVQKEGKGIVIISKPDNLNAIISELKKWASGESDNVVNFKEEQILLNNIPATKITYKVLYLKPMSGPGWEANIFVNENKNLQIHFQTTFEEKYLSVFNQILSTFRFIEELVFISPKGMEEWEIGEKHTIKISQPVKDFYPFIHLTLNKPDGERVGIISCKIGGSGKTVFDWDTESVLNYCGAGLEGKINKIEPGVYIVSITKDTEGLPILASTKPLSIIGE